MDSLSFLDLSNNSIQHVEGLPLKARVILSLNHRPLNFTPGVLTEARCLIFEKGTIPDRLFVLIPKISHAPKIQKMTGLFSPYHRAAFANQIVCV